MAEAEWKKRHREIEKIHRRITARLDESDRRAAEREKERRKQRKELRAKLRAYGLREVTSDELLERIRRLSDTVDRNLRARQEKVGRMAEAEWKGRVDRLDEVTIVQARILERLERKYDDAIQRHDEEMAELRAAQRKTEESLQTLGAYVQVMSATVNGLAQSVDQFIRGKEGNGQKQ